MPVLGVNLLKDSWAGCANIVGGRSGAYERELGAARDTAMANLSERAPPLRCDAILGIDIDYEVLGSNNGMLMVGQRLQGTVVRLRARRGNRGDPQQQQGPAPSPWMRPGGG